MESEEEQRFCSNCKRYVSSANFGVHSAFCERNIFVCTICDEPVQISEKDQHLEEYHIISPCNLCEAPLEKWLLPKHMELCPKRLVECKYCEASFPLNEHPEHVEFCGSRTEKCLLCQKYIMNKDKSKHNELHLLEKQCRAKSIEVKQNKVNEVICKKSTTEKICEKTPASIHSMPSRVREGEDFSDKLKNKTCRDERNLDIPAHRGGTASLPERETPASIHSMPSRVREGEDFSDKLKNKTCRDERNLDIPAHRGGIASLPEREFSKHYTQCHICKQTVPWIDYNTHVPACASSAGKCSLCGEHVPSHEIKEHMKSHSQGGLNKSLKVSENYESSNETSYRSNQSNVAKSKIHSSVMKCPYCSELCSEDQVLEHTRSCRKNMYECPLCCEKIPEKDKKRHEELECRMIVDSAESNTPDFSRHSQSCSECPLCFKQIPEENYDSHVTLQCEQLFQVGGTHELCAAGEDLYECIYCLEKMPQKDKGMHQAFSCRVLLENSGINISGLDSYAEVTKKTDHNSSKSNQSSETCPTCKNTFSKGKISEHRNKCCRRKELCTFCNQMIDVACNDIHLQYCPGIDNRDHSDHKITVTQDSRLSNYDHKGAIPKNTSIKDMMKPRSAKCTYCHTSYNVDILPNHEKECIHMPIHCEFCGHQILLKDVNTHKCKRKKGKFQRKEQQISEENGAGSSFWSKTKNFFKPNDGKEVARDRRIRINTEPVSYFESQAYGLDSAEKLAEKLYFEQADNTLLPCEFCQQEFPASQLVLHETGCQPHLVSYAKPDLPDKSDSKQGSVKKDSTAFKSQNIHSAGGISHPFFAKNSSVITHDASEHIEHNRKSKTGELPQSCYDKKSSKHLENSKKNENDVEKKSLNFQSVWNVTNISDFRSDYLKETLANSDGKTEETTNISDFGSDYLKEILANSDGKTEETTNLNENQKGKGLDQQTPAKQFPKDNEIKTMLKFLKNGENSESDDEFVSLSDENEEQENSEMKVNSSINSQKIIEEKQGESPVLKKITNEEKSKEVFEETLKSSGKAERNPEEYLMQNFRFGSLKTTLPFEDIRHGDIQSEKKYEEPSRCSETSKNQKENARHIEHLSDLKLGGYQSVAFSGDANVNEKIDKEPENIFVKKATKFTKSCNDQKNYSKNSKLLANFNLSSDALPFDENTYLPVQTVNKYDESKKLHEQKNPRSRYCTNDVKENFSFFKTGTDFSTVLSDELQHLKVLPKEHNKEPKELYNQNKSRHFGTLGEDLEYIRNYRQHLRDFKLEELYSQNTSRHFGTLGDDLEYIRNYRQHLPDFKFRPETVRKHSQDNVTNITLPESRNVRNVDQAFTLEPASSPKESKLPLHTLLKTGVKEVGLEEKIAAFEQNKNILSSLANNNTDDVTKWRGWRKKEDVSDSD